MQHKKQESIDMLLDAIDKLNDEFGRSPTHEELCKENELLLIIKTKKELFDKIEAVIKAFHSYNVPEIIALPVILGSQDYLGWIEHETT